jgi:enoyl-CoA hydratase/carnithine racemase
MTTEQLREVAKETLEGLPPEQLKVAAEFLRYLDERASDEATEELLKIPGLLEDLEEAERDFKEGMGTPVEKLRRKYKRNV